MSGTLHEDLSAFLLLTAVGNTFEVGQRCKENPLLDSLGNTGQFLLLTATCRSTTIPKGSTVSFKLQQSLRERTTLLCFKYAVYIVNSYLTL